MRLSNATGFGTTNGFSCVGTSANPILLSTDSAGGTQGVLTVGGSSTASAWLAIMGVRVNTTALTANNSFNLGGDTGGAGWTINAPGCSEIIGG